MSAARGNPKLQVRFDPDHLDRLREAFPAVSGRSGGVALAVRQLLHLVLDEPIPEQYGEVRRAERIDKMEDAVRRMERSGGSIEELETKMKRTSLMLSKDELGPVERVRLQALLGRMWVLLSRY